MSSTSNTVSQFTDTSLRNIFILNSNTLTEIHQMRRGIQTYPIAPSLQHRSQHGCSRTLPIGSSYMECRVPSMGVFEPLENVCYGFKPKFYTKAMKGKQILESV